MNTSSSTANTPGLAPALRYSAWFMLAVGALSLAITALGANGEGPGGVLVLAGASILLPATERAAKVGLAIASVALAVASLVGTFS